MNRLPIDDSQTIIQNPTGPGDDTYREPTKEPDMNPEVTLPWDNKEDNKDQNEPSIEDTMIQAVLRIISLNCHLTIMFHEYGSSIFMDKVMASDLIGILGESSQIINFIAGNVDAVQKANK